MTLRPKIRTSRNFVIFCVIGCANTAMNFAVVAFMIENLGSSQLTSNVTAFFIANIFSFLMNSSYNFNSKISMANYFKFLMSSFSILIIAALISYISDISKINYIYNFIFILIVSPVINYIILRIFVFKN